MRFGKSEFRENRVDAHFPVPSVHMFDGFEQLRLARQQRVHILRVFAHLLFDLFKFRQHRLHVHEHVFQNLLDARV